jgi:hypothetical protein
MVIGETAAVTALWEAARDRLPPPREDRPGQPVYAIDEPPPAVTEPSPDRTVKVVARNKTVKAPASSRIAKVK